MLSIEIRFPAMLNRLSLVSLLNPIGIISDVQNYINLSNYELFRSIQATSSSQQK